VILENNFYEVDHHNHDFAVIVELFLKKYNRTYNDLYKYVFQHETKRYFNNKDLRIYFIKFHNENTTLRFTSKNAIGLKKERNYEAIKTITKLKNAFECSNILNKYGLVYLQHEV
jgi:hypothetical protein